MKTININKEEFKEELSKAQKEEEKEFFYRQVPFSIEYANLILEVMEVHSPKSLKISYSESLK